MIIRAMTKNSIFATGALPHRPRFVLVNNRVPRSGENCALCGDAVMDGYVRDLQTQSVYCDSRCFAGGACRTRSIYKMRTRSTSQVAPKVPATANAVSELELGH
jgi:hypothetical protein